MSPLRPYLATALLTILVGACTDDSLSVKPLYNPTTRKVVVEASRELEGDEALFVRTRRGAFGTIDCAEVAATTEPVSGSGLSIEGPEVEPALTKPFYGPEWGYEPTPAMLASLDAGTDSIIDVCVMRGDTVVTQIERDLFAAWDDARASGLGGKADNVASGEVMINTPQVYGERCVNELGEIPFFTKQSDGQYTTYNCLDSAPIPLTVTRTDGNVDAPQSGTVTQCDNPQYIYSLCEAGPRVAARTNEQGTRWVLLCRKSIGGYASDQYNDIALIGSNPFTGKTCFFQNALYSKKDGGHVPHPADPVKSTNLWSGVHGGIGNGIECSRCHDADAFVHTPWIDGAKDAQGRPIVPKMGVDADLPLGANDTPYKLINRRGQNWTMEKQLVSPQANACLRCHRMGGGRWAQQWLSRLEGTDGAWTSITTAAFNVPAHMFWMPPDTAFPTQQSWDTSEAKRALDFIQTCGANPSAAGCVWTDIPETVGGEQPTGNLRNPVAGTDDVIASQATKILGMNRNEPPTDVCSECHAPNQTTLNTWQETTDAALSTCLLATTGSEPRTEQFADQHVAQNEFKSFGPFEVAAGGTIEVHMTGTGDADLYVKRGTAVTTGAYDCRPYGSTSNEDCTPTQFNATGPAKFWVGVNGYSDATVSITVSYKAPGSMMKPAKDIVDCMRLEPGHADSPFAPGKVGIYAAAAHLGWFQDTFRAAYPAGEGSNTEDTWTLEYGRFKSRSQMPKGNHPRLTQGEFDVVAEWFARGLPKLSTYIAQDTGPSSCTTTITPAVGTHATQMATLGWAQANRSANMNMYGCSSVGQDPRTCLTAKPNANSTAYGAGWSTRGTIRVLRELAFSTVFWMRSSPDGRFVANGASGGDGAVISDLQANKDIGVNAAYDPGFFPDNKGWVFQGTPIGAGFCTMGLLTSGPDHINFSEPQCSTVASVNLYQHLGAALNGGDYFVVNSQFTSDFPGGGVNRDPYTGFGQQAQIKLTPMLFDGTRYVGKPPVSITAPSEGDSVLSPSTKLVVSRFGNDGNQLGFVLRKVNATPNAASYDVTAPEIGRYCVQGGKPAISFDERYMVFHHYVGPADYAELGFASAADPTFQSMLAKGTANLVLVDLVTGVSTRITAMHPGQYALYPHFRSDGWIYFLARDLTTGREYVAASDAALQMTPVTPSTVTLDPPAASVGVGGSVQLTITLNAVAPAGGTQIALAVIPASGGSAPASVTIPAGQSSATFAFVDAAPSGTVSVRATLGSSTATSTMTVATTTDSHLVINEVDYDMPSTDNAELIEIYNPSASPVSLAGKQVLLINGTNGAIYNTITLSGTIAANGYLVIAGPNVTVPAPAIKFNPGWTTDKIQNGAPDGIALIDNTSHTLIDALSYEGSMTTINVPGFTTPISLVEGATLTVSDTASPGALCRRGNQDTNNAAADWALCATLTPGQTNPQ